MSHLVSGATVVEQTRGFFYFNLYFSDFMADYYSKDLERRKIKLKFSEREDNFKDLNFYAANTRPLQKVGFVCAQNPS